MLGWRILSRTPLRGVSSSFTRFASTKVPFSFNFKLGSRTAHPLKSLKDALEEVIPAKQEQLKKLVRREFNPRYLRINARA